MSLLELSLYCYYNHVNKNHGFEVDSNGNDNNDDNTDSFHYNDSEMWLL